MTDVIPWAVDSAPEASPQSATALYLPVRWPVIHNMESILLASVFFEAVHCAARLPDTGFEETATVSVV